MLNEHIGHVADATRLALYKAAISKAVSPGDSVADLGCGTGVLGLLCLRADAGQVYAVDDSVIDIACETFTRAGLGNHTAQEIEASVLRDNPDLFPSPMEIWHFVYRVLGRDTE